MRVRKHRNRGRDERTAVRHYNRAAQEFVDSQPESPSIQEESEYGRLNPEVGHAKQRGRETTEEGDLWGRSASAREQ